MASRLGQRDLTTGAIGPTLLAFALPTLGSSVLQSLNGSINAVWIGRFLGETALAATTNGNLIMFMLLAFVFGFGMASTILIGKAFGRKDVTEARRVLGTAVGSFVAIAAQAEDCVVGGLAATGWLFAPELLRLLGTPETVLPLALSYVRVIFVAMPATLMLTMLMMASRGSGDSLTPLWFMVLSVVLDSGLNPFLIRGIGPFPELGIAGAGTATAIANYVSLAGLVGYIYLRDLPLRLRGAELKFLRPDPALLRHIMGKGFPMGLQMIVISSSALAMMGLVNREGVHTTAAYGVAQQLWTYVQMPAMALGAAVSTMVAQNIGAKAWDRVPLVTRSGVIYSLVMTGPLVALLLVADRPALALFLGADSPALPIAHHIQLLATWGYLAFGVSLVLFGTVRADGQVVWPLIIMFVAMYPVRLGFAYAARPWLGADALWLSFPLGMVATLLMAILLYRRGHWREANQGSTRRGRTTAKSSGVAVAEHARSMREPAGAIAPTA